MRDAEQPSLVHHDGSENGGVVHLEESETWSTCVADLLSALFTFYLRYSFNQNTMDILTLRKTPFFGTPMVPMIVNDDTVKLPRDMALCLMFVKKISSFSEPWDKRETYKGVKNGNKNTQSFLIDICKEAKTFSLEIQVASDTTWGQPCSQDLMVLFSNMMYSVIKAMIEGISSFKIHPEVVRSFICASCKRPRQDGIPFSVTIQEAEREFMTCDGCENPFFARNPSRRIRKRGREPEDPVSPGRQGNVKKKKTLKDRTRANELFFDLLDIQNERYRHLLGTAALE